MKKVLVAVVLMVGMIGLAIAIGQNISPDATAAVLGVSMGVLASIPTVVVILMHKAPREQWPAPERYQQQQPRVNVMIVQQPAGREASQEPLFLPTPNRMMVMDLTQFAEEDYPLVERR